MVLSRLVTVLAATRAVCIIMFSDNKLVRAASHYGNRQLRKTDTKPSKPGLHS
jgi:hypothetical protein